MNTILLTGEDIPGSKLLSLHVPVYWKVNTLHGTCPLSFYIVIFSYKLHKGRINLINQTPNSAVLDTGTAIHDTPIAVE